MNGKKVAGTLAGTILKMLVTALIIVLIYLGAMKTYEFGYAIFADEPKSLGNGKTASVTILADSGVMEIGKILEEKNLIEDAKLFYFQEYFSMYHKGIQPGVYELDSAMTPDAMLKIMAAEPETEE